MNGQWAWLSRTWMRNAVSNPMPYYTRTLPNGKVEILRMADRKVVGTSDSKAKAEASIRARMMGEKRGNK